MEAQSVHGDVRWLQRFSNFERAFLLLRDALNADINEYNDLEKEGIIQRFEYTFELSWKVLKDKMEYDGLVLERISPKIVIREAYASKYILEADTWMKMSEARNLMSHTYDFTVFTETIITIKQKYLPLLNEWYLSLLAEINN